MYKLVSIIDSNRWSFMDGYQIYGNVVWLGDKNEMRKYKLIDENGNVLDIRNEDYLVEV